MTGYPAILYYLILKQCSEVSSALSYSKLHGCEFILVIGEIETLRPLFEAFVIRIKGTLKESSGFCSISNELSADERVTKY